MENPVGAMTVDPGGFYVAPAAVQLPPMPRTVAEYRPVSLPIVERYSGDPFAAPTAFRPSTDRFLGPWQVPQLVNHLARTSSGSQYAPAPVPASVPSYTMGNGIGRVVPATPVRNVDVGRPS